VVDTNFNVEDAPKQILIAPADPNTGLRVDGATINVLPGRLETWADSLEIQGRINAAVQERLQQRDTEFQRLAAVVEQVVALAGPDSVTVPLRLDTRDGNITISPDDLLTLVQLTRVDALKTVLEGRTQP
jgi:hypothetical protein